MRTATPRRRRRWSDSDKHFWFFTYSTSPHGTGLTLCSGDDENPGCCLRLHAFKRTLVIELPPILRPHRKKVMATGWDAATIARLGRDWYWIVTERQFGARKIDDAVHFQYGAQTHDSSTDRSKCWFIPWLQWRHVRHSLYDLKGALIRSEDPNEDWSAWYAARKAAPHVLFDFDDFDGERIVARTRIEEREWRRGTGWFRWLSLFSKPRISRILDLDFSKEVGRRKGSWKGGTIGHSIIMQPYELHRSAFKRYCAENNLRYIGILEVKE